MSSAWGCRLQRILKTEQPFWRGPIIRPSVIWFTQKSFWTAACAAIKSANLTAANVSIFVNPRRISIMRGLKNSNIALLKGRFGLDKIDIIPDISIDDDSIKIDNGNPKPCF